MYFIIIIIKIGVVLIRSPFSQKHEGRASETVVSCIGWSLLRVVFTQGGLYSVCRRCQNLLQFQQAFLLQQFHQLLCLLAEF